jgi:hypothetical protein
MRSLFEDGLTSCLLAFRVRILAQRGKVKVLRVPAQFSGFKSFVVSENADRLGLLLRTSLLYELAGLTPFSKVWKKQATPAGRSWWVLTTLAPRTEESESGSLELWTTPDTCKGGGSTDRMNGITHRPDGSYITLRLETQSKMWATPRGKFTAEEPEVWQIRNDAGKVATPPLGMQAKQWPTPRASEQENRTTKPTPSQIAGTHGKYLASEAATWPTPTVQDGENNAGASQFERNSLPLNAIVSTWPTPRVTTSAMTASRAQVERVLNGEEAERGPGACKLELSAALWPTPRANDPEKRGTIDATNPRNGLPGASQTFHQVQQETGQASTPNTGRLNSRFVTRLMGYPDDWFDNSEPGLQFSEG